MGPAEDKLPSAALSKNNKGLRRTNCPSESPSTKAGQARMLQIQLHPNPQSWSPLDDKAAKRNHPSARSERRKAVVLNRSRSVVVSMLMALSFLCIRAKLNLAGPAVPEMSCSPGTSAMIIKMCERTNRCQNFENPTYNYTFLHISKCAGSAWIRLLKNRLPGFQPFNETGEPSLEFMKTYGGSSSHYLLSLKSPRRHLWSLFAQCKYSRWGLEQTASTSFPNDNQNHSARPNPATDEVDFEAWLDHFLLDGEPSLERTDTYMCYHPSNYQSRSLTTHHYKVRQVIHESELQPKWDDVMARYWKDFHWAGLAEFFHESKCLLFYRLSLGPKDYPWADEFVSEHCRCPTLSTKPNDTVIIHHKESHRETFWNMRPDLLQRVGALTKVDVRLYRMALYQFFREIVWLESRLGRQVLCDDALERNERELAYVFKGDSKSGVSALYNTMKTIGEPVVVYY